MEWLGGETTVQAWGPQLRCSALTEKAALAWLQVPVTPAFEQVGGGGELFTEAFWAASLLEKQ